MLVERMKHFLLLLMIVAAVKVLRLILLVHVGSFHSFASLLPVHLGLHLGHMSVLVSMHLSATEAILQILAHPHHTNVVASWRIDSRTLVASLKLIETTRPALCLMVPIGNVASLE